MLSKLFTRSRAPAEERAVSIASPDALALFGATPNLTGVPVTEASAMGLSAVYACVGLISSTIAALPMRTVRTMPDGTTVRENSWLDEPCGPMGPTRFEWIEAVLCNLLLHGNHYSLIVRGGAGQIVMLQPLPPSAVTVEVVDGRKRFRVTLVDGAQRTFTENDILHIPGLSLDGVTGVSPLTLARNMLGTAIAGERAAARLFKNGLLASAIVTPNEAMTPEEASQVREALDRMVSGEVNAGTIAIINRSLQVQQWQISPEDAEFLASRKWSVNEIARLFRVPPHMVGDVERSTSWGAGIQEQTLGFQRFTLSPWTCRIEARLSRLLPADRKVEFDYRALLAGSPAEEIELLLKQTESPILTVDEARAILNRPVMPPEANNAD